MELESGGRLLLWPDVNLSKRPQLGSAHEHSRRIATFDSVELLWIFTGKEKCTKGTSGSTVSVPRGNGPET